MILFFISCQFVLCISYNLLLLYFCIHSLRFSVIMFIFRFVVFIFAIWLHFMQNKRHIDLMLRADTPAGARCHDNRLHKTLIGQRRQ